MAFDVLQKLKTALSILNTPLGKISFSVLVDGDAYTGTSALVEDFLVSPNLPIDMSVGSCSAVLLKAQFPTTIRELKFICRWEHAVPYGDRNSGEGLDAQSWDDENHIVMIGTEDADFLGARRPDLKIRVEDEPIEYLTNGFVISLSQIPAHKPISLHYVVATNPIPEPADDSVWFAVDIPHAWLSEQTKGEQSSAHQSTTAP